MKKCVLTVKGARGKNEERYTLLLFLGIRKAHGKESSYSRWQVSGIRESCWIAERQGFEIQVVSLHAMSRKADALASDLFQIIVQW